MQNKDKHGFFSQIVKSIKDFDKYEDFAIEKTGKSMKYICLLILIFAIVVYVLFLYKFSISDTDGLSFFKENILNINYSQQELNLDNIDSIIVQSKHNVVIPIWIYILYLTSFLVDAVILGVVGYIISLISRIRIKYKACFNLAVHALTLPIILELIYMVINSITGYEIKYFNWMYTCISYVYMIVAILMIKTDFINRQLELIKLEKEQQKVREELQKQDEQEEQNKKEDNNKENKEEN